MQIIAFEGGDRASNNDPAQGLHTLKSGPGCVLSWRRDSLLSLSLRTVADACNLSRMYNDYRRGRSSSKGFLQTAVEHLDTRCQKMS